MESKEDKPQTTETTEKKPQRKLKFKTLDGQLKSLECDYDIQISELKKLLTKIYNIEPNRQRLINKGKQFKDDEHLDKLVDKDDTIIHLVFRSEEDVKRAQENAKAQNATNNQNNNQNSNTININMSNANNANPFQNILNVVANSEQVRNLTNNIVQQFLRNPQNNQNSNNTNDNATNNNTANSNTNNNNNANNNNVNNPPFIGTPINTYRTLNVGETLNLDNSPLRSATTQPININLTNNVLENNNQNTNNENTNSNLTGAGSENHNYLSQFPITPSSTDSRYESHLKNINIELNEADNVIQNNEPKIPLPLLNTTQNVFTAISRCIRRYVIVNQNILVNLMRLADLMEREQYITDSQTRLNANKLLDKAYKSLSHVSKASKDLSNIIKASNFNTAPNTGYIGVICQEIGLQSSAIPLDFNAGSLLASLNNNQGGENSMGPILLRSGGLQQGAAAAIPISINLGTRANLNNNATQNTNLNNNVTQNVTNNNTNANSNVNNDNVSNNVENKKDNADENKEKKEEKKVEEVKKETEAKTNETNNNNTATNGNINNNATTTQNPTPNANNNSNPNDFNNLFGSMMSQLMTPENLNNIAGAVGSMLNPNQGGQSGNAQSQQPGGFLGNLFSTLMGGLGGDDDDGFNFGGPQPQAQAQQTAPVTENKNEENKNEEKKEEKKEEKEEKKDEKENKTCKEIFKKFEESPQSRRDTKLNEDKKLGQVLEPNIEFVPFTNEVVSKLTVQEVFDMYNLNFRGLNRLRKDIKSTFFPNENNDETIKKIIEILCERIILMENEIDKIIPGKEFICEDFLNKELKKILDMFINENSDDEEWNSKFRKVVLEFLEKLIDEVKQVYESGEEGAKAFLEFNLSIIIENIIGNKLMTEIQNYNEDVFNRFVENACTVIQAEKIKKNNEKEEKKEEKKDLLTIDEIFKIAAKDKERIEKEEQGGEEKKYSDFYYLTSLFK